MSGGRIGRRRASRRWRGWAGAGALAGAALLGACGCAEGPAVQSYQSRVVPGLEPEAAFDEAAAIMRREFGRVHADRESLTITAPPREYTSAQGSGTARGLLGVPSTLRRSATMRIRRRGAETIAEVRVDVARRETQARLVTHGESRISDLPGHTPIERDAATTPRQNAVWTPLDRDRRLERALLDELAARAERLVEESAAGEEAGSEGNEPSAP